MGFGYGFGMEPGYAFGMGPGTFDLIFIALFTVVMAGFIVAIAKGIHQWNQNNHSPRITVPAVIVSKRADITCHHTGGEQVHHHTTTSYHVTFQLNSGDRTEFQVPAAEYGLLAEGDHGDLSFQGTRYLGFARR